MLDGTKSVSQVTSLLRKRLTPDRPISEVQWDTLVRDHLSKLAELGLLSNAESGS